MQRVLTTHGGRAYQKAKTGAGKSTILGGLTQRFDVSCGDDAPPDFAIKVDHIKSTISIHEIDGVVGLERLRAVWEKDGVRACLRDVLQTSAFDSLVSLVVIANSVSIGLEQKFRLEKNELAVFRLVEVAFLLFYTVELCLQFCAWGLRCLSSNWVRFDCTLVFMGILSWLIEAIFEVGEGNPVSSLLVLRIARLLRLARVARAVRLVSRFRELGMLARGLLNSMGTAFHTLLFGIILLYVVGCAAMELVPLAMQESSDPHDGGVDAILEESFRSLPVVLLTLVQFITFDNAVQIYKPLIEEDATLALFFMPVLLLVGVVYMNLVTAIIVNSGLEQSRQEKELKGASKKAKSKRLIAELEEAFLQADVNDSGTISRVELDGINLEGRAFLQGTLGVGDLVGLFDCLDVDGRGEIGIQDFCRGVDCMVVSETSPVIKRMEVMIEGIYCRVKESERVQERLLQSVEKIASAMQASTGKELPEGRGAGEARTGDPGVDKPGKQTPDWVDGLLADLKQVCTTDIRRAMNEACMSFLAQVTEGALTPARAPQVTEGALTPARTPHICTACSFDSFASSETCPADQEQFQTPARRDPLPPARGLVPECHVTPAQLAPAAAARPPTGAVVPAARRPELLVPLTAKVAPHGIPALSSTQAL